MGVSVSAHGNRVLLDSQELNAASGAFNLCCGEAYARFTELKRAKIHPGNMTKERDAVSLLLFSVTHSFLVRNRLSLEIHHWLTPHPHCFIFRRWRVARQMFPMAFSCL